MPNQTASPTLSRALPTLLLLLTVFGPISMDLYLPALPALTEDPTTPATAGSTPRE